MFVLKKLPLFLFICIFAVFTAETVLGFTPPPIPDGFFDSLSLPHNDPFLPKEPAECEFSSKPTQISPSIHSRGVSFSAPQNEIEIINQISGSILDLCQLGDGTIALAAGSSKVAGIL